MFDPLITLAGALVGFVVGLTGMGGGALMTPLLVLLFGIEPLTAVSSDIVASLVMKPVGGGVHLKHGTVNRGLVKWLVLGSVPSAFLGVVLLQQLGMGPELQARVKVALGIALFTVSFGLIVRPLLARRKRPGESLMPVVAKPLPTMIIGVVGGLVVGLTSVGSGSLIIIMLLMLYPSLKLSELVGTDLVQAVPLVASAAVGHILYGDFQVGLTGAILLGSLPGV
ncbi:MAG TPA: sulfite exporter TauE/SafE family protein, partial [Polyangiaceae bacterium]